MSETVFLKKWLSLPADLQKEVENFMDFLASKKKQKESEPKPKQLKRRLGLGKGMIKIMDDFDDPIEGLEGYM